MMFCSKGYKILEREVQHLYLHFIIKKEVGEVKLHPFLSL